MGCMLRNMWEFADEVVEECFRDSEQHVKRFGNIIKHFVFKEAYDFLD